MIDNVDEYLGKRMLYMLASEGTIREGYIWDYAPSKVYVKIGETFESGTWVETETVIVIEMLK